MLSDKITIVVPCKNEENYIGNLLVHLRWQAGIGQTRIIIADCSTDNTRKVIEATKGDLNVEIIEGGQVSVAKNNGANLVKTPYILFIDSDVRFFSNTVLFDTVEELEGSNLDLIGLYAKCYDKDKLAQLGFMVFNIINRVMSRWVPFAVGAFMLTRKSKFDEYGGFAAQYQTSEDFFLSKKYHPSKFKLVNHYFGQDSRRFKKMGYFGMGLHLISNLIRYMINGRTEFTKKSKYWK